MNTINSSHNPVKAPYRKLRGYAFDPSLSLRVDTVAVNDIVYKVEWEELEKLSSDPTKSVPKGEYIDIIDYDPASGVFYPPIDFDDLNLILQDGYTPNVNNPQFHQQMVYAVIMTTIKNFEQALGRKIQWAEKLVIGEDGEPQSQFVQRLRVYPHALRQANAFYHPEKKALLFGYFNAAEANPKLIMPASTVFTCLSHDIIAHETTHAILDGLHRRYIEPTHPDTRAFHEGFADLVALFQHFTFPEVLKHQISRTRGDLESQNLLGQLAQEFGNAIGGYGSLRDALGRYDKKSGQWIPDAGSPSDYHTKMEFHDRGSILVAAVFNAFLTIYKKRATPLLRIATGGSGVLPAGELHPDLVNQLSKIASKTAGHILRMLVRALDYCPPIDITFGDYLRAIITSDRDMVPDDLYHYRIAFIEAFQKRGIFPQSVQNMSAETLCHPAYPPMGEAGEFIPDSEQEMSDRDAYTYKEKSIEAVFVDVLRTFKHDISYEKNREKINEKTKYKYIKGTTKFVGLHQRISERFIHGNNCATFSKLTGLMFPTDSETCKKAGLNFSQASNTAKFEIGNVWLSNRTTPDGRIVNDVVITIFQNRRLYARMENETFTYLTDSASNASPPKYKRFKFRGGCTLIFDLETLKLKYAIKKDIDDRSRMEQQFKYLEETYASETSKQSLYFDAKEMSSLSGPFAFMHNH